MRTQNDTVQMLTMLSYANTVERKDLARDKLHQRRPVLLVTRSTANKKKILSIDLKKKHWIPQSINFLLAVIKPGSE